MNQRTDSEYYLLSFHVSLFTFHRSQFLQPFSLIVSVQSIDKFIQCPFEHVIELVQSQANAVISNPVLWIVVCPDTFTPVTAANLGLSVCCTVLLFFVSPVQAVLNAALLMPFHGS